MNSIRLARAQDVFLKTACSHCADNAGFWDQIADAVYCPTCVELLAQGEIDPVIVRAAEHPCAVCFHPRTVRYLTFPKGATRPVEIDLCGTHLRALVGRCLSSHAFLVLRGQLHALGLKPGDLFLLHEEFYDLQGQALQPVSTG